MVKSSGSTRLVVLSLRCCLPYYEYYESFSPHPRSFQVSHQPTSPPASLSPFPIYSLLQYPGSLAFGAWARPALTSTTSGQNKTQASTPRCISGTLHLGCAASATAKYCGIAAINPPHKKFFAPESTAYSHFILLFIPLKVEKNATYHFPSYGV